MYLAKSFQAKSILIMLRKFTTQVKTLYLTFTAGLDQTLFIINLFID